jgi:hypothetical protein
MNRAVHPPPHPNLSAQGRPKPSPPWEERALFAYLIGLLIGSWYAAFNLIILNLSPGYRFLFSYSS